jgi:hypothetical protein
VWKIWLRDAPGAAPRGDVGGSLGHVLDPGAALGLALKPGDLFLLTFFGPPLMFGA